MKVQRVRNVELSDLEQVRRNLWKYDNRYYRMTSHGVTPNGCWLIGPEMIELADIEVSTGKDVYGTERLRFHVYLGTVPAHYEFVNKESVR